MPAHPDRRAPRPKRPSSVADRISAAGARLTATDRKVADIVAREPQAVAFGTVADVAAHAGTSGPSVVRLAAKLGYAGFAGLQADVRAELASQLAPAVERIRRRPAAHPLEQALVAEVDNVRRTLETATPAAYEEAVVRLADRRRAVAVLAGEAAGPVGALLADQLDQLRPGVVRLSGSPVAVARQLAGLGDNAVVVAIDLRRYERWVADGASRAAAGGPGAVRQPGRRRGAGRRPRRRRRRPAAGQRGEPAGVDRSGLGRLRGAGRRQRRALSRPVSRREGGTGRPRAPSPPPGWRGRRPTRRRTRSGAGPGAAPSHRCRR